MDCTVRTSTEPRHPTNKNGQFSTPTLDTAAAWNNHSARAVTVEKDPLASMAHGAVETLSFYDYRLLQTWCNQYRVE